MYHCRSLSQLSNPILHEMLIGCGVPENRGITDSYLGTLGLRWVIFLFGIFPSFRFLHGNHLESITFTLIFCLKQRVREELKSWWMKDVNSSIETSEKNAENWITSWLPHKITQTHGQYRHMNPHTSKVCKNFFSLVKEANYCFTVRREIWKDILCTWK